MCQRTIRCGRSGNLSGDVLGDLNRSLGRLYASEGRPSIPPEQLLSALLLQVFYGIRSERQLMEQLDYNLLYRWFVGLSPDAPVWDPTTFTKNRERLQNGDVFTKFTTRLSEPSAGQAATVGRALLGGWNADRSLGFTLLRAESPALQGRVEGAREGAESVLS